MSLPPARRRLLVHGVVTFGTLAAALWLYVNLRGDEVVLNDWLARTLGWKFAPTPPRGRVAIGRWYLAYSFPTALWVFAATALTQGYRLRVRGKSYPLAAAPLLYGVAIELAQATGVTDGYPDPFDVLSAIAGWLLGLGYLAVMRFRPPERTYAPLLTAGCFAVLYLGNHV